MDGSEANYRPINGCSGLSGWIAAFRDTLFWEQGVGGSNPLAPTILKGLTAFAVGPFVFLLLKRSQQNHDRDDLRQKLPAS